MSFFCPVNIKNLYKTLFIYLFDNFSEYIDLFITLICFITMYHYNF